MSRRTSPRRDNEVPAATPAPEAPANRPAADYTFICYARRDSDFVLDLAARLREREREVWLDQWNIGAGDDWDKAIDAALRGCATFLIVLSPDAVQSDEVRGELRSALNERKRIIPVLYRPCDIPRQLQSTQYLDIADSGEMTDALVDDLVAALRGESAAHGDRWRDARKPWAPLSYVSSRLRAVGASAVGGVVLVAITGVLAEGSYARLLGVHLSLSAALILKSGLQFFITLLWEALVMTLPVGVLLVVVIMLGRAARRLFPAAAAVDRLKRASGRPGLLWTAQLALYAFLFLVSLPAFADLLPLADVAFSKGLLDARVDTLTEGARHYRAVVLHVSAASLMLAALEAWRRRLHRQRQIVARSHAMLSLGLALPLYLVVCVELLLLPIGHGLLKLPTRREYSASIVTFSRRVPYPELKGSSLLLVDLRPTAPYRFYCPQGSKVWDVHDEDVESFTGQITGTLAQLLPAFRPLAECRMPSRAAQEVER